jgi:hypothetical protein
VLCWLLCALHLLYVAAVRPYNRKIPTAFSIFMAAAQVVVFSTSLWQLLTDGGDVSDWLLAIVTLVLIAGMFVQLVVEYSWQLVLWMRRRPDHADDAVSAVAPPPSAAGGVGTTHSSGSANKTLAAQQPLLGAAPSADGGSAHHRQQQQHRRANRHARAESSCDASAHGRSGGQRSDESADHQHSRAVSNPLARRHNYDDSATRDEGSPATRRALLTMDRLAYDTKHPSSTGSAQMPADLADQIADVEAQIREVKAARLARRAANSLPPAEPTAGSDPLLPEERRLKQRQLMLMLAGPKAASSHQQGDGRDSGSRCCLLLPAVAAGRCCLLLPAVAVCCCRPLLFAAAGRCCLPLPAVAVCCCRPLLFAAAGRCCLLPAGRCRLPLPAVAVRCCQRRL